MSISPIYNDAQSGKLTEAKLKQHLDEGEDIDGHNTDLKFTPIMAAVLSGRYRAAKLLIDHNAMTHAVSASGYTALWLAASKTNRKRREIVQLLLGAPQARLDDLDKAPTSGEDNTPVMEAVRRGDSAVVRLLVDAGANLTLANRHGKRAKDFADERMDQKMIISLLPAAERHKHRLPILSQIGTFLRTIFGWVNLGSLVSGVLDVIFGLAGRRFSTADDAPPTLSGPGDCQTVDDFKKYAKQSGLERFFPADGKFLQRLVDGIADFKDKPSPLNTPERLEGLVKLALFQPVLFCDDSTSMNQPTSAGSQVLRIEALRDVTERITRICTMLVPDDDGTVVRFINQNVTWGPLNPDQISEKMRDIIPKGGTKIGTRLLERVLEPLVYAQLDEAERAGRNTFLKRPYLICIITDGCPTDGDMFAESMQACIDRLENLGLGDRLVSFVVCQIGDDSSATTFLRTLMTKQQQFGDSVYVCKEQIDDKFSALNKNNDDLEVRLLEILVTPLMR